MYKFSLQNVYASQNSSSVKYGDNEFHINFPDESSDNPIKTKPAKSDTVSTVSRSAVELLEQILTEQKKTNEILSQTVINKKDWKKTFKNKLKVQLVENDSLKFKRAARRAWEICICKILYIYLI